MDWRIPILVVIISLVFGSVRTYHHCYIKRSKEAEQAEMYLKSDVCRNATLRVQLGKYQECTEAEYELAISASTRALYDLLEYYSFCGSKQRRCEAVVHWFGQNRYVILGLIIFLCWLLYQWVAAEWQYQRFYRYAQQQILPIS